MKKHLLNYFICLGITFLTTACSLSLSVNNNIPQNTINDDPKDKSLITMDTINLKCSLISVKINTHEDLTFPFGKIAPTLIIKNNGRFSGFGVCNSFFGKYTKKGNLIRFENTVSSQKNCIENIYIEDIITSTLGKIDSYSIEEKKLLLKKDGDILMIYRIN